MADNPKKDVSQPAQPATPESPQAEGVPQPHSFSANAKLTDLTIGELSSIIAAETNKAIASRIGNLGNIGVVGSHVNSGPPGFVNGGGHANFDPKTAVSFLNVTLPDGSQVAIPATGPVDLRVRRFHIKR